MNEQSHKEEMSAAIRGDFERLRERGVPVTLAPHEARRPDEEPRAEGSLETPPADGPAKRRSWLARLAGR